MNQQDRIAFGFSSKVAYVNISYIQVLKVHICDYLRNHSNLRVSFNSAEMHKGVASTSVSLRIVPPFFDENFSSLRNEVCCLNYFAAVLNGGLMYGTGIGRDKNQGATRTKCWTTKSKLNPWVDVTKFLQRKTNTSLHC